MLGNPVSVAPPKLDNVPRTRLVAMRKAGQVILDTYRALERNGSNVVAEILRGQGDFYEWDHYPAGDVYDWETHAQYYYHAHPPERRGDKRLNEHGHFHTFLRPAGFPRGIKPAPVPDANPDAAAADLLSHLVAISMDHSGYPVRLFTTNRWVTGETWYKAADVARMSRRFRIDQPLPSPLANTWITGMLTLFGPTIEALLDARDARIKTVAARVPGVNIYEFRGAEILAVTEISVEGKLAAVENALAATPAQI